MEQAIEAVGLVKKYPKGVTALDGLSFAVAPGRVFALLGPNGAGKSTAVKILTTLATPDSGRALVGRLDVVSQGSAVDIQATGRENLRLQGQIYGLRGPALAQRAEELLERFGLADAADRIARGYSGGMQRRLDIAMALVHDPEVLFLDEPTTGLDPEVRADMWAEISRLAADRGKTVLLTTHYLEEADQLAERIAIVDRGQVVAEGTPEELKRELRGDAIHVDLEREYNGTVTRALADLAAIRDVTVDGRSLRARSDDGGRAVPAVLAALESAGVEVSSVRVARPSLDDVYLKYTGRTFDAAENEAEVDR